MQLAAEMTKSFIKIDAHERKCWENAANEAKRVFFSDIMQLATEMTKPLNKIDAHERKC